MITAMSSIGANGCDEIRTPHLDRLSETGTVFDNAHCQGSMHPAICVPSRASLMTGRNIFASAQNPAAFDCVTPPYLGPSLSIPTYLPTFPQRLREAGYRTHATGKWHNDREAFARSFSSGDRMLFGGMSDHERVPVHGFDPEGVYPAEFARIEPGFSTDIFAESAMDFLSSYHSDSPFCLYVSFTAPHDPRTPLPEFVVDPSTISLPENYMPVHPFDNGDALVRDEMLEAFPRTPEAVRRHLADYYGMIAHVDAAVGNILSAAEEAGLLQDTVVIYTADHGLALGQHGLLGKQSMYEHSTRVPLIFNGPGMPAGMRRSELVWHADTRATILDLAGLQVETDSEGESLLPVMRDECDFARKTFAAVYRTSQRMIRGERYKLIRYFERKHFPPVDQLEEGRPTAGSSVEQLFDLDNDPNEQINLICLPALQEVRASLGKALLEWQLAVNDPILEFLE